MENHHHFCQMPKTVYFPLALTIFWKISMLFASCFRNQEACFPFHPNTAVVFNVVVRMLHSIATFMSGEPNFGQLFLTPFPAGKSSSETTPPRNQVLMSLSLKRTGDLNGAIRYLNRCLSGSPEIFFGTTVGPEVSWQCKNGGKR